MLTFIVERPDEREDDGAGQERTHQVILAGEGAVQVCFDDGADDEEQAEIAVDSELLALRNPGHLQPRPRPGEQYAE